MRVRVEGLFSHHLEGFPEVQIICGVLNGRGLHGHGRRREGGVGKGGGAPPRPPRELKVDGVQIKLPVLVDLVLGVDLRVGGGVSGSVPQRNGWRDGLARLLRGGRGAPAGGVRSP